MRKGGATGGAYPFIDLLGLRFSPLYGEEAFATLELRDELLGDPVNRALHGGVIAAMLDAIGGYAVFQHVLTDAEGESPEEKAKRLSQVTTIDLRVDYLRPGRGTTFTATASILRAGSKVAAVRMELRNEEDHLLAVASGTYR